MTTQEEYIPDSWSLVRLGDFVENEKGKKPKNQQDSKDERYCYPYIDIEAFEEGVIKSYADGVNCRFCSADDFLMVWDGSRSGLVGKGLNGALGSTLVRINFPGILNDYAYYFLQSKYLQINSRAKGSGTPHVDPDLLWNYSFPIPPENEQYRIVAKIEELFSELDKGIESLNTAREQLKVYRQALLKQAFEGKLTQQWRKDNADKVETAEQLLERIKQEREARYQQQLQEWQAEVRQWEADGKKRKKPTKPRIFQAPEALTDKELGSLAQLPQGSQWVKVGQIFDVYVGATPSRKIEEYWGGDIPWISSGEVAFRTIKDTEEKITKSGFDNTSTLIHPIGTVMLAMIGEGKTRGQAAILNIEASHNQNTAAIRVSETNCSTSLFYYYLLYQYELTRLLGSGNNQKALNKDRVSNMTYPLFSIEEQVEISRLIDEKLTTLERIESDISLNLMKTEGLRQSIMKKAFSGQLVPQDSNDEPASILLERIAKKKMEYVDTAKNSRATKNKAKAKKTIKRKAS